MDLQIVVSGNIVTELSEKIPSNIIALNELIKNAYDASANKVIISLDTYNKKLVISDDGDGMSYSDIKKLLHIGKSEKHYGKLKSNGRYTQGSKGLGFLSSFKFGKSKVIWDTYKETCKSGIRFELNYEDIINTANIEDYNIIQHKSNRTSKGTTIEMDLDDYNVKSLENYLNDEINRSKILYSFLNKDFEIAILINDKVFNNKEKIALNAIAPKRAVFNVKYDSTCRKIQYIHNNHVLYECSFDLSSNEYKIILNIIAFDLT